MKMLSCWMILALGNLLLQFSGVHSQDNVNLPPESEADPCPHLHSADPKVRTLTLLHAHKNDVDGRLCCLCPRGTFYAGICNVTIPQSDTQFHTTECTPCPEGTYMEDELHKNKACSLPTITERDCGENMQFIPSMAEHAPRCDCLDGYFKLDENCVPYTPCEHNHEVHQFGSPDFDQKCRLCRPGYKSEGGSSRCTIIRKPPETTPLEQPSMTTPVRMSTVIEEKPQDLVPGNNFKTQGEAGTSDLVVRVGIGISVGIFLLLALLCFCLFRTHKKKEKLSLKDSNTSGGSSESSPTSSDSRLNQVIVANEKPGGKAVSDEKRISIPKHKKESDSQEEAVPLIDQKLQKPSLEHSKKSVSTRDVPPVQFRSSEQGLFKRRRLASENKAYDNEEGRLVSEYIQEEVINKIEAQPIVGTTVEVQGAAHGASHSPSRIESPRQGSATAAQLDLQKKQKKLEHMDRFLKAESSMLRGHWKRFGDLCGLSQSVIEEAERGEEFQYNLICKLRQTKGSDFNEAYIINRLEAADLIAVRENFQAHMRNYSQGISSCPVEVEGDDNP
uniref:uncharacterized protein LOC100183792 isoform X2 n=1 Tax=Ciona intestinalis TaxID=7719 RepID=UPI000EF45282|nr:uncharacterized protein LOC100183792 isoform X2 [Ciona intestinalis]|eukprot:XP_026693734.1 uncharacterized protein LOC100183792 isoform X2 [Ciona intestinalis]